MKKKYSTFPSGVLMQFFRTVAVELGRENLDVVLQKAGLASDEANSMVLTQLTDNTAGAAYAALQQAIRIYYGRGARGILMRVGKNLWKRILEEATFKEKTLVKAIRALPVRLRVKQTLALIARVLSVNPSDITVHSLDMDWMLVDHTSPTAKGLDEGEPICFITLGMIQEAIYWATGKEYYIEEIACQADGGKNCEFKIVSEA